MHLKGIASLTFASATVTQGQRRIAVRIAVAMAAVALAASLLGRTPGSVDPGVLAALVGVVTVTELLSALLLFHQYIESRATWLAAVGAGYFFSGLFIIGYLLTFPHVFSPSGYFGANEQTALSLWCVWHAGFPLAMIAAAAMKRSSLYERSPKSAATTLVAILAASTLTAAACVYFFSRYAAALPTLLNDRGFTPLMVGAVLPLVCVLDVLALLMLTRSRPSTTVELWLPIAVLASMLDAVMGVIGQRYSIVWYVGKSFAVTSSSIMVTVFLTELAAMARALARSNRELHALSEHVAKHDAVTDLPNRRHFEEQLREALVRARERNALTAVLHVNLDRFGTVNEALGTAAADELLREIARRIQSSARGRLVGCAGGDEFLILLSEVDPEIGASTLATAILAKLRQSYFAGGQRVFLSASVGIAIAPSDAQKADELLAAAATGADLARRDGGNQLRFYCSTMHDAAVARITMEADMRAALRRREFRIAYQPIVDIVTRRVVSAEALLRWQHPRLGLLPPDAFIPAAEQNGMMVPIGAWVLETVVAQVRRWRDNGMAMPVAVNVSVREFQDPAFYDRLSAALCRHSLEPRLITIEITESLAIDDSKQTQQTLARCRELGVGLSLDDFGTSYACLANVKRLPIGALKIDRGFVRDVATSRTDAAIVTAILGFAKSLELTAIAEGVETREQLQCLRTAGCAYAQGYLFARALPAAEFESYVRGDGGGNTASLASA